MTITITTSNVNGIRAAKRKGIEDWAGKHVPDVWCIQEVRAILFSMNLVLNTPPPAKSTRRPTSIP